MACSLIKYLYVLLTPISACYKSHFLSNSWTSKEFCFDQKKKKKSGSFHLYWITSLSFIDGCLEPPFTQEKYSNGQKKLKKAESSEATRAHGKLAFYFQGQREPDCGEHGMGRGHLRRDPPRRWRWPARPHPELPPVQAHVAEFQGRDSITVFFLH